MQKNTQNWCKNKNIKRIEKRTDDEYSLVDAWAPAAQVAIRDWNGW